MKHVITVLCHQESNIYSIYTTRIYTEEVFVNRYKYINKYIDIRNSQNSPSQKTK